MAEEQAAAGGAEQADTAVVTPPNEIESITTFVSDHPVLALGGLALLFMGFMLMRSRIPVAALAAAPAAAKNPNGRRRKSRRY